ncbi:unnamed protein product [Pieris brassicae]|uniref:Integrase catalytic domain-containing protein n=1 Tax=Pieris brassicae TaxID=7116 RepID=A0A9P0T0E7_PIEBR|nr:unnamed protein product [Pieris brassicae]
MALEDPTRSFKETFYEKILEDDERHQGSTRKSWTRQRINDVMNNVKNARVTMLERGTKKSMHYYWLAKYDIMETGGEEYLIFKRKAADDPIIQIVAREDYFDILLSAHNSCGHGGRDKIVYSLKSKLYIPIRAIQLFVALCPTCDAKRHAPRKSIDTRPTMAQDFNIGGQVDLIDFQSCSDGEFKWLLNYEDNATKFVSLRPLKSKRASEVAMELMKIFMTFGAPYILQSDNGREFTANIIEELTAMWPEFKIIHGSPRRPETQGSVERSNQDVENMLRMWMKDNKSTNWSVGCYYVQYNKNSSFHRIIGRSPYKALFGNDPKAGLGDSKIPSALLETFESEQQLKIISDQVSDSNDYAATTLTIQSDKIMNVQIPKDESEEAQHEDVPVSIKEPEETHLVDVQVLINKPEETQLEAVQAEQEISFQRNQAHIGIKRAAEIMIEDTAKKLKPLNVGSNILINVPKVDRGLLGTKNIRGRVVDFRNGVYRVGTKTGTIKSWFPRHQLQESVDDYHDDVLDVPISLREAVRNESMFGGQGFQKCTCKPAPKQCFTNRCACYKNKVLCCSKCHSNLSCINK